MMWSHYANKWQGVRLGFDLLFENHHQVTYDTTSPYALTPVTYSQKRPVLDLSRIEEVDGDPLAHAEIAAMREAAAHGWNLADCTLVVTLEPCPMCAGAIIQSHIRNLYFGARDEKAGACGSVIDLFLPGMFNHDTVVFGGVCAEQCSAVLQNFFKSLRDKKD